MSVIEAATAGRNAAPAWVVARVGRACVRWMLVGEAEHLAFRSGRLCCWWARGGSVCGAAGAAGRLGSDRHGIMRKVDSGDGLAV